MGVQWCLCSLGFDHVRFEPPKEKKTIHSPSLPIDIDEFFFGILRIEDFPVVPCKIIKDSLKPVDFFPRWIFRLRRR